jgi:hypothetical protein
MALHHGSWKILSRGDRDNWIAAGNNCQQELLNRLNRLNLLDRSRFDSIQYPATVLAIVGSASPTILLKAAVMRLGLTRTVLKSVVCLGAPSQNLGIYHLSAEWLFLGGLAAPFRPLDRCSGAFHPLPKFSPALMIPGEPADKESGE